MKILITGSRGMLARTLIAHWTGLHELVLGDLPELDITNSDCVETFWQEQRPDVVVHCAAVTQVDWCEDHREEAFRVNAEGTGVVAKACRKFGCRLIYISTDYVFAGDSDGAYDEYMVPDGGRTVYGQSKFAGEQQVAEFCPDSVITRISWLYGAGGPSFIHTMRILALSGKHEVLKVVDDQIGNPTSTLAVATALDGILSHPELRGVFHVTCEGESSWCGLACELFRELGIAQKVLPCTTEEFPRPAPRPANSRLIKRRLKECGLPEMPKWEEALKAFLETEFPTC